MLWQELRGTGNSAGRRSTTDYPGRSSQRSPAEPEEEQRRGKRGKFSRTFRISYLKKKASDVNLQGSRRSSAEGLTKDDDWHEEEGEAKNEEEPSDEQAPGEVKDDEFVDNKSPTGGIDGSKV